MKNSTDKIKKNAMESLNNRTGVTEEIISELEDKFLEILQLGQIKEEIRELKSTDLQNSIKSPNIQILGVPEVMERENGFRRPF